MQLVSQGGFSEACQQAVIAMIAGVTITDVIAVVGSKRLNREQQNVALDYFDCKVADAYIRVENLGERCLGVLRKEHKALWLTVLDALDPAFSHSVLMVDSQLFDPHYGVNPHWPWSHYVCYVRVVEVAPILGMGSSPK
jgi:hypothetical protein